MIPNDAAVSDKLAGEVMIGIIHDSSQGVCCIITIGSRNKEVMVNASGRVVGEVKSKQGR